MIKSTILILAILTACHCTLGVVTDISYSSATSAYACIVQSGRTEITVGISSSPTAVVVDAAGLQLLTKARNTFTKVSLAFYSCRGRDPIKQVDEFVKKVANNLYNQVYVYLGQESLWYQCSPSSYTPQQNCDYMKQMTAQFKKYNVTVGIATDEKTWGEQCANACNDVGTFPLFWTAGDKTASFSNWKTFGGWKNPDVKLYDYGVQVCGVSLDLIYRA